jgi:tRNA 2-thiouridine synthesizing protein D
MLLLTSPYTYQNSETFYEIAKAALEKGHEVKVFLFVDGVNNAKLNQEPDPERPNLSSMWPLHNSQRI